MTLLEFINDVKTKNNILLDSSEIEKLIEDMAHDRCEDGGCVAISDSEVEQMIINCEKLIAERKAKEEQEAKEAEEKKEKEKAEKLAKRKEEQAKKKEAKKKEKELLKAQEKEVVQDEPKKENESPIQTELF